jgi:hypothetical protein
MEELREATDALFYCRWWGWCLRLHLDKLAGGVVHEKCSIFSFRYVCNENIYHAITGHLCFIVPKPAKEFLPASFAFVMRFLVDVFICWYDGI